MNLTKREIVRQISEETGLIQSAVFTIVQKTLNQIAEALANGYKVELRNFGVFDVIIRKARIGRNPQKPETDVKIPARSTVRFKAGKEMKAEVLKLTPKPNKKAKSGSLPSGNSGGLRNDSSRKTASINSQLQKSLAGAMHFP